MREAVPADAPALAAYLERHIESSMFLLGNLKAHGIGNRDHPHGTTYLLRETVDGITGVFGRTNGGFLMCQMRGLSRADGHHIAEVLRGYRLLGITGVADQVGGLLDALALPPDVFARDRDEPLFRRDIAGLSTDATLRIPAKRDLPLLSAWYAAYLTETRSGPHEEATDRAVAAVGSDSVRLMVEKGRPVAMSAINAWAGHAVQIGGVYVPPELRGAGRGGRVVAAQLAALRGDGVTTAILFAASSPAARAYERIGFVRCGTYRVALLKAPVTIGVLA